MPARPANPSGHLHKKRRPVSITSSREASLSPSPLAGITWGNNSAYLPYYNERRPDTTDRREYHPIQDELYGVPVLADQVAFEDDPGTSSGRRPYLKRIFQKDSRREDVRSVEGGMLYPADMVGMDITEKQDLAKHARLNGSGSHTEDTPPRNHKPKKSVSWHPEIGPITSSSAEPASRDYFPSASAGSTRSEGSDKTIWPFTRKPRTLSEARTPLLPLPPTDEHQPPHTPPPAFEFTPRVYVPLWSSEQGQMQLPTTPERTPTRHRRMGSICRSPDKPGASFTYPPTFSAPQGSPSPSRTPSGWPVLPPFAAGAGGGGGAGGKVYTPPSPFEHSIAGLAQQQAFQADVGRTPGKWKRVEYGDGDGPSRTFRYAAEDWLRTL